MIKLKGFIEVAYDLNKMHFTSTIQYNMIQLFYKKYISRTSCRLLSAASILAQVTPRTAQSNRTIYMSTFSVSAHIWCRTPTVCVELVIDRSGRPYCYQNAHHPRNSVQRFSTFRASSMSRFTCSSTDKVFALS